MDEIAVLIPCYNEEYTISKVIKGFQQAIPEAVIYVYDNASDDCTADLARNSGAIVGYEPERGKGNVVRRMFREIDARCYILVDGDGTYDPEDGFRMAETVLNGEADMVVGDRMSGGYESANTRPFHTIGNKLVITLVNALFGGAFTDILTGYRAVSYSFAKSFKGISEGFEIETELSVYAAIEGKRIRNTDIAYKERPPESPSKLRTFHDGIRILWMIVRLFRIYRAPVKKYTALQSSK